MAINDREASAFQGDSAAVRRDLATLRMTQGLRRPAHRAVLACGDVLHYGSRTFLPQVGDSVPCRRHGFCVVVVVPRAASSEIELQPRRARRRTLADLLLYLTGQPIATVAELRRHRFTLRLLADAAREGLLVTEGFAPDAVVRLAAVDRAAIQ
jgi:hypothetical protein